MSKVVIKQCESYGIDEVTAAVNSGMDELGGWDKFVKNGDKVLLKVNLIGPKPSDSGAVTNNDFIRALTRILKERGCTVWIGDSAGGAIAGISPSVKAFAVSGLTQTAEEEGAEIKNFDKEGVREVKTGRDENPVMYLAKPLFDADVVINVPKLKTHVAATYTGAFKNLYGCIPGLKKAEYHKMYPDSHHFGRVLTDLNRAVKADLHIMDGITAMQGRGPTSGTPYPAEKILIGTDPLAVDTVGTAMMGLNMDNLPIFDAAVEAGDWTCGLENISICGDFTGHPLLPDFEIPEPYKVGKGGSKMLGWVIGFLKTRPKVNIKKCVGCNTCVESCPMQVIDRETKKIDYKRCIECMCCHELCMYKAVELKNVNPFAGIVMKMSRGNW